jgi:catechol 2,3-dioxygenase-like lactoylglutathione lyase family enzyme
MITQLAHVCLAAPDLVKAEHFYCAALGLKKHFRFVRNGRECGFYLAIGNGNFIEIFAQPVDAAERPPIRHLCLQVTGMDEIIARVRAHGYAVTDKKLGADRSWQCWLTDPSGVRIELHEYTPASSQLTGHDCTLG